MWIKDPDPDSDPQHWFKIRKKYVFLRSTLEKQ